MCALSELRAGFACPLVTAPRWSRPLPSPTRARPSARGGSAVTGPHSRPRARGSTAPLRLLRGRAREGGHERSGSNGGLRRKRRRLADALAPAAPHAEAGFSRERVAGSVPGWWDPAEKAGAAAGRASAAGRAPGSARSSPTPPPGRSQPARSRPSAVCGEGIMSAGQQGPPPPPLLDEPPAPPGASSGEAAETAPAGPAGADAAMEVRRVPAAAPRTLPAAGARHEGRRGGPGDNGGAGAGPRRASRRLRGAACRPRDGRAAPSRAPPSSAAEELGGAAPEAGRGGPPPRTRFAAAPGGARRAPAWVCDALLPSNAPQRRRAPRWRQRVRGAETSAL